MIGASAFHPPPRPSFLGMHDDLKPRRPRSEEQAEINDRIARAETDAEEKFIWQMQVPPGMLVLWDEEAALDAQKAWEDEVFRSDPEFFFGTSARY